MSFFRFKDAKDVKALVNAANCYKQTPLYLACVNGYKELVPQLLQAGADPNARLVIHIAEYIQLLKAGADRDARFVSVSAYRTTSPSASMFNHYTLPS